jgi:hypothetical protein
MQNCARRWVFVFLLILARTAAQGGRPASSLGAAALTVVDENGLPVARAQVVLSIEGRPERRLVTDYAGHVAYDLPQAAFYGLRVEKPGFYAAETEERPPYAHEIRMALSHEQMIQEEVNVTASTPGIDTQQISDSLTLNVPEIVNIPYPTSRDIRNLLPFYPGIVADPTGQIHIDGSETWATLDTLDQFDIRSPVSGNLAMRVSADAVRSIDRQSTRYPVEYGRSTGGVVAFYTGMGDNHYRFNATDFLPSFQEVNGIRFDKFLPRVTFSGPLARSRAWFFDGLETEYDNIYIRELPAAADTNHLLRGSNLSKFQLNAAPSNILSGGLLVNAYHSPFDGISPLVPQASTTKTNIVAWLPYFRDQQSFAHGALLDLGVGLVRFTDGYEPHGNTPFAIDPETTQGSYFENAQSHSQRVEGNGAVYLAPRHGLGLHNLRAGLDIDHIGFDETVVRAPVDYLREDGTLLRQSTFPATPPFARHNAEIGVYGEDRWTPRNGLLLEPGLRLDWDEIIRRPLVSPRVAAAYAPSQWAGRTKFSAGIGAYFEHTQLEYLTRAFAGERNDTYFAADGVTPSGPALATRFVANYGSLREARAINWSLGVEHQFPASLFVAANLIRKRVTDEFSYRDPSDPSALSGTYALTNARQDHDNLFEAELRRSFAHGYTLFAAYTRATAHTSDAIEYYPTLTTLGPQQSGPLPWDTPNRVISWGWLPFLVPWFRKNWDFVYTYEWRTGFPYTAVNADQQVVGRAGAQRFPDFNSFSPGLEWRFRFRGATFGLRGVIENISDAGNYFVVNNVVDSPQYGTFSEPLGRAITARIRLISSKK